MMFGATHADDEEERQTDLNLARDGNPMPLDSTTKGATRLC
jgi:hypothetical protein